MHCPQLSLQKIFSTVLRPGEAVDKILVCLSHLCHNQIIFEHFDNLFDSSHHLTRRRTSSANPAQRQFARHQAEKLWEGRKGDFSTQMYADCPHQVAETLYARKTCE